MTDLQDLTDGEREMVLLYLAKRWPEQVEAAVTAIRELELGQTATTASSHKRHWRNDGDLDKA